MYDRNEFPDDVPIPDAAEQQRPTADSLAEEELTLDEPGDVPLEADVSDWQEQQQAVPIDPELEEPDQRD
ncbi:hypothetical protein [Mycobacterium asiaticum]|uniref:hypothetical protein n=1 Tax=Mycobacterium asiaticum TaxID=1790 RepID=UPI0007EFB28A|nr:hypothetical protein [Mycobacterium asiaticum]OBI92682.1 hypothetical protein A5661_25890 [Mycobacterium asiaticum]OBJ53534.1 hypothetical protein A9W94_23500 [Mycobacterium asiaticum]